jgi:predicted RNase H-like nuclease (RuvC/YqgF family)
VTYNTRLQSYSPPCYNSINTFLLVKQTIAKLVPNNLEVLKDKENREERSKSLKVEQLQEEIYQKNLKIEKQQIEIDKLRDQVSEYRTYYKRECKI